MALWEKGYRIVRTTPLRLGTLGGLMNVSYIFILLEYGELIFELVFWAFGDRRHIVTQRVFRVSYFPRLEDASSNEVQLYIYI